MIFAVLLTALIFACTTEPATPASQIPNPTNAARVQPSNTTIAHTPTAAVNQNSPSPAASPTFAQQAATWAQFSFYSATIISIAVAATLGIFKYKLFRTGRPFITITLTATSRPCSDQHVQVGVTAQLHNGSRVLAKAQTIEWECRAIGMYSDNTISEKRDEYFGGQDAFIREEDEHTEFPWNVQQRIIRNQLGITIEPGEYSHENVSFVVPWYCTAVQIRLFIPVHPGSDSGWTAVAYHDTQQDHEETI